MALTDYLRASDGNGESVRCIVVDPRGIGDMVFNNTTPTNWFNYFVAMAGTVDPVTDRFIEGEYIVFKGHLDGSAITIDELAPGYTDNGNLEDDIIVIKPTTLWADIVADVMDGVEQATTDAENAADAATTATGLANTATSNANAATSAANAAAQATSFTQGTAAPSGGYDGNFYLRTTTYDLYQKISGTWTIIANIKGATGLTGTSMLYGSGAPSAGLGNNGDLYWRTDTSQMCAKAAGSWSVVTTINNTDTNAVHIADTSLASTGFFLDEDDMASNSATKVPSQQSVKAYVDNHGWKFHGRFSQTNIQTTPLVITLPPNLLAVRFTVQGSTTSGTTVTLQINGRTTAVTRTYFISTASGSSTVGNDTSTVLPFGRVGSAFSRFSSVIVGEAQGVSSQSTMEAGSDHEFLEDTAWRNSGSNSTFRFGTTSTGAAQVQVIVEYITT